MAGELLAHSRALRFCAHSLNTQGFLMASGPRFRCSERFRPTGLRVICNTTSGSFLFSLQRLLEEGAVRKGDHAVMMTMGPGTTIETALVRF